MKNKILVIVCAFALCFSLLVIPSFADEPYPDTFTFYDDIFGFDDTVSHLDFNFRFQWNYEEFLGMEIAYHSGYWTLIWNNSDGSSLTVYDSESGWQIDEPVTISLDTSSLDVDLVDSLLGYGTFEINYAETSWYDSIYNIIKGAVFGDRALNSSEDMSISLVALLLSIGAILLPVLFTFGIFIWILKRM